MNKVFIATSLDGYIADENGGIEWLETFPDINTIDTGYKKLMSEVDALLMGRATFEKVSSFDIDWPYTKPVFVMSNSWTHLKGKFSKEATLVSGSLEDVTQKIHGLGHKKLYLDGGGLIQSFLRKDLIDEMIITVIPILLGAGIPLFSDLPKALIFECKASKVFLEAVVQNHFVRKRN